MNNSNYDSLAKKLIESGLIRGEESDVNLNNFFDD